MTLSIDILTPDRRVLQAQADSVVVPAADGELGILAGHTPLVAQLRAPFPIEGAHLCVHGAESVARNAPCLATAHGVRAATPIRETSRENGRKVRSSPHK